MLTQISASANTPTNIEAKLCDSSITYNKGGSIVLMMTTFLGPQTFRRGLIKYLHKKYGDFFLCVENEKYHRLSSLIIVLSPSRKLGTAVQADLFESLDEQAAEDGLTFPSLPERASVMKVMKTWTTQPGLPVLSVEIDYNSRSAFLKQVINKHIQVNRR